MKILHIVPSYKPAYVYGGPIESISRLCEGLAEAGNEVHVFTTTANGKTELDVQPSVAVNVDGVRVYYFNRVTKDPTHVSPDLWKELYGTVRSYDVVHIHSWWNILVLVAAKICLMRGVMPVVAPRGMLSKYIFNSGKSLGKKLIHRLFGASILKKSYFHATAEAEAGECQELIKNWKGFTLPNILSLPDATIIPRDENAIFTLLFLSRIHPKKGIEILFHAISRLPFDVKIKIAGNGEDDYIQELKDLAVSLKIEKKVIWLGWKDREEKFIEMRNADLFVLTSLNENFANVVIEALHMGTAVMLSKDVALSSFIAKHDLGWVTSTQVNDVEHALMEAISSYNKLQRIRDTARNIINEQFSAPVLIKQYIEEYDKIARAQ
jgi:glycosyltransferase involved in cell wall biosynthesis